MASGPAVGNNKVKVQMTQAMELYLINETAEDLAVGPMELFGFGLGSFAEQLTRDAKHNKQAVHFLLRNDGDLVVYQSDDQREKKVFNLASLDLPHRAATWCHGHQSSDLQLGAEDEGGSQFWDELS